MMKLCGTSNIHLSIGKLRTCLKFRVLDELFILVKVRSMLIDRFIKSIHPTDRKIVPQSSPPIPSLTRQEPRSGAENNTPHAYKKNEKKMIWHFCTVIRREPKYILVARPVV